MLSVGPFVDAPAAAGPADTAAPRNPKDVIANGMCSANILLSLLIKMNRAVKFYCRSSWPSRSHRLQDATAD